MTEVRTMLSLAEDYLTERRALGFDLRIPGDQITAFARFVDEAAHTGPLTTRITLDWVQGQAKHAAPFSWARRLDVLRPFARYLTRLDPATEFPQTAIFGRSHRRLAPHIYSEQEICDLLAAARHLAPHGGLRPATYETIFGLIAATGLRLSEALHLRCGNVDLDQGVLTVRNTKFRKSRHVPMHATAVAPAKLCGEWALHPRRRSACYSVRERSLDRRAVGISGRRRVDCRRRRTARCAAIGERKSHILRATHRSVGVELNRRRRTNAGRQHSGRSRRSTRARWRSRSAIDEVDRNQCRRPVHCV